jgi:hypothetical protein
VLSALREGEIDRLHEQLRAKATAEEFALLFAETADVLRTQREVPVLPGAVSQKKDTTRYLNIAFWEGEDALRAAAGLPESQDHGRRLRALGSPIRSCRYSRISTNISDNGWKA